MTCGLCLSAIQGFERFLIAAIGAASGYALFRLIDAGYQRIRGRDGLGAGDAKLFAGGASLLEPPALAAALFVASLGAISYVLALSVARNRMVDLGHAVPFGPFLAFAIWLHWLFARGG